MKIEQLARIVHEANRIYCQEIGDNSQEPWENTSDAIKDSAIDGVQYRIDNPKATPKEMHDNWVKFKKEEGWKHGKEKNAFRKTHPCICAYKDLPDEQKRKDDLFSAIVGALHDPD